MHKLNYLLGLCFLALVLSACAEGPEFRTDTLESTTEVTEKLGDRGVDSCEVIKEMGHSNTMKNYSFPLYRVTSNTQSLQAFALKLAQKFVGSDAQKSEKDGKVVYEKGQKILRLNEGESEITFIDQEEMPFSNKTIDKTGVVAETKKFVNEFSELGSTSDYYIDRVMGGSYTEYAGSTRGGEYSSGRKQSSGEIVIRKVKEKLPLLGGVGSIRISVRPNQTVEKFKIKFLDLAKGESVVRGDQLLSYTSAEAKARKSLEKEGKDAGAFEFSCEFGYLPDTIKGTPSKLVPGYILHGTAPNTKSVLVVVSGLPDGNVMFEDE